MPPTNTREPPWRFSRDERTLVLGALLNSMAFFAALPFAALYLADRTDLPTAGIGAVVSGIAMIAALGGLAGGMLADRFGTVRLMRLGLLSNVLVYVALAFVTAPVAIIALFLCLGVGRTMVEPSMKKLLSLADTGDGRIFRVRYITLCLGAIVGPAVGGLLYHASPTAFFLVPAAFFALYLAVMVVRGDELARLDSPSSGGAGSAWTAALRDPLLLAAIGAGAVVFLVFSQMDTAIPLYMKGTYGDRTEYLFASLLVVNAVLALLVQPLVIRLSERLPHGPLVRRAVRASRWRSPSYGWGRALWWRCTWPSCSGPWARRSCCRCRTSRSTPSPPTTARAPTSACPSCVTWGSSSAPSWAGYFWTCPPRSTSPAWPWRSSSAYRSCHAPRRRTYHLVTIENGSP